MYRKHALQFSCTSTIKTSVADLRGLHGQGTPIEDLSVTERWKIKPSKSGIEGTRFLDGFYVVFTLFVEWRGARARELPEQTLSAS